MDRKKVQTLGKQSLLDIAVQTAGSVEASMEAAIINNISVSDDELPAELLVPEVKDKNVQLHFSAKRIKPATASDRKGKIFDNVFNSVFQ